MKHWEYDYDLIVSAYLLRNHASLREKISNQYRKTNEHMAKVFMYAKVVDYGAMNFLIQIFLKLLYNACKFTNHYL